MAALPHLFLAFTAHNGLSIRREYSRALNMSEEHVIQINNNAKGSGSPQQVWCNMQSCACVIHIPITTCIYHVSPKWPVLQQHGVLRLGLVRIRPIECRMPTLSNFLTVCTSLVLSRVPLHLHLHWHWHATDRILLPRLKPITESCMVINFSIEDINPVDEDQNASIYIQRGGVSHKLTWLFNLTSLDGYSQGSALLI